MRYIAWAATPLLCLLANGALAQSATGVGVGIAGSSSQSKSSSVAISGQGGRSNATGGTASGNGTSSSALTINSAAQPAVTTTNVNTHSSGTVTEKNVPSTFAPGLTAAGLETCLGSVSGGASVVGFGGSFGTTIPDPGCAARLDARTLWSMGLKKAAIARLCLTPEINRSMPDVCGVYMPQSVEYAPQPLPASFRQAYAGGQIELIEGKTGKARICNDYDATKQRCRVWAR